MAYFLADSDGPLADFLTIGGLAEFRTYAEEHPGPLTKFLRAGYTEDTTELAQQANDLKTDGVNEHALSVIRSVAPRAKDILILTDGMSHEEFEIRAESAPDNTPLHQAADAHLAKMQVAVRYAFAQGRAAINTSGLNSATTAEEYFSATTGVKKAVHDALLDVLPSALLDAMKSGGEVGVAGLTDTVRSAAQRGAAQEPFGMKFNATSPDAIAWAKEHAAELAVGLSDTSVDDIQSAIAAGLEGDLDRSEVVDRVTAAVGDIDRAEQIARTETMTAANQGLLESWSQAQDAGLLGPETKKEWVATAGACDDCDELDGEQVLLDDDFSIGDDPPAHPSCRCTMGIA